MFIGPFCCLFAKEFLYAFLIPFVILLKIPIQKRVFFSFVSRLSIRDFFQAIKSLNLMLVKFQTCASMIGCIMCPHQYAFVAFRKRDKCCNMRNVFLSFFLSKNPLKKHPIFWTKTSCVLPDRFFVPAFCQSLKRIVFFARECPSQCVIAQDFLYAIGRIILVKTLWRGLICVFHSSFSSSYAMPLTIARHSRRRKEKWRALHSHVLQEASPNAHRKT